jgi:membrane dipeptidase
MPLDHAALHRQALVIDAHNDTIVAHLRRRGRSLSGAQRPPSRFPEHGIVDFLGGMSGSGRTGDPIQIDFASMAEGGIDAGFFSIDVTTAHNAHLAYAMDGLGFFFEEAARSRTPVRVVRTADDILDAKRAGHPAVVLAVENANCTEGSLNVLRALYELGVRSIGLTHHTSSVAADGCFEAREGVGLTRFGVSLVAEMNRLGMLVDLAHVSPAGFFHALEVSSKPVIFSHGNTTAVCDFPRNLTDEQLGALARARGVIGMSLVPDFVAAQDPTLDRFLDHIDHAVHVGGIDCVGLGSDFDGGGTLLAGASQMSQITRGLLQRGYSEADVRKILGENTLRVLRESIG